MTSFLSNPRPRISAVGYLNASPLVWGFLHGRQKGIFDLRFELPAECAESIENGSADLGLVPIVEVERQGLDLCPGLGIASDGPVRSILLVSKAPASEIQSIAMDQSSRTSVALALLILAKKFGATPSMVRKRPSVEAMLQQADAALVIGDPALHYDLNRSEHFVYDLGYEWRDLTGLPMVYAAWAGKRGSISKQVELALVASYRFGRSRIEEILASEAVLRGFDGELARDYLTNRIVYELSDRHYEGMTLFRELAREHNALRHLV